MRSPDRDTSTPDRAARVAAADAAARRVFGDADDARGWLAAPNPALGGRTPLGMLCTPDGAERVQAVLTRIEHGVFE